jgi:hypothetical protein
MGADNDRLRSVMRSKKAAPEPDGAGTLPASGGAPALRTAPVRSSIDLAPQLDADVRAYIVGAERRTGLTRITKADVGRILFERLVEQPELQQSVEDELRRRASRK